MFFVLVIVLIKHDLTEYVSDTVTCLDIVFHDNRWTTVVVFTTLLVRWDTILAPCTTIKIIRHCDYV